MNKTEALNLMIETVKEFGQCSVILVNGDEVNISPATDYVGGEEGYYMSTNIGNVMYDNIEEICSALLKTIDEEIEEVNVD